MKVFKDRKWLGSVKYTKEGMSFSKSSYNSTTMSFEVFTVYLVLRLVLQMLTLVTKLLVGAVILKCSHLRSHEERDYRTLFEIDIYF